MGIINGTTNYILTRMAREGAAYADVLADARRSSVWPNRIRLRTWRGMTRPIS
ncbi:MAG: hypothetical protein ACLUI3_11760 [Christensenellales bacterium]